MITTNEIITEEQKNKLEQMSNQLAALETDLAAYHKIVGRYEVMKAELTQAMEEYGVQKIVLQNGTKLTYVEGKEPQWLKVQKFAEFKFKEEHPRLYQKYIGETTEYKAGRKSYVRVSLPKENDNE